MSMHSAKKPSKLKKKRDSLKSNRKQNNNNRIDLIEIINSSKLTSLRAHSYYPEQFACVCEWEISSCLSRVMAAWVCLGSDSWSVWCTDDDPSSKSQTDCEWSCPLPQHRSQGSSRTLSFWLSACGLSCAPGTSELTGWAMKLDRNLFFLTWLAWRTSFLLILSGLATDQIWRLIVTLAEIWSVNDLYSRHISALYASFSSV